MQAVISVIGRDRPGLVHDLTELIVGKKLNVNDSRMTVLGGEFAVLLLIDGAEASFLSFEDDLNSLCEQLGLSFVYRTTEPGVRTAHALPYSVRVMAMDHPGIVHRVAEFFSSRSVNIQHLTTETQKAAHTGTPVFNLLMHIHVPSDLNGPALRAEFDEFCATEDLDGLIEPGF